VSHWSVSEAERAALEILILPTQAIIAGDSGVAAVRTAIVNKRLALSRGELIDPPVLGAILFRTDAVVPTLKETHMAEERDEIRKIIEGELAGATAKQGLVVRRVGRPLSGDELRSAGGGLTKTAPGDQCCNGAG
jgi:hypothetical protein